jgi:hypothetical protein
MGDTMVKLRLRLWQITALAWGSTSAASHLAGFTLTANSWGTFWGALAVIALALSVDPSVFGRFSPICRAADALMLFTTICIVGAVVSYLAMHYGGTYTDQLLHRADAFLGFDWVHIRLATERHPTVLQILTIAYFTTFLLPFVVIAFLCGSAEAQRLYHFIAAYGSALIITLAAALFFPAQAAFVFYGHADIPFNAIQYGDVIAGLRDGSMKAVDLQNLGGIITFPSFHATMAVLFVWALWPFRSARTALVLINGTMWLAAVPVGGHYVVDLIGGSVIAAIAIMATSPSRRARLESPMGAGNVGMTAGSSTLLGHQPRKQWDFGMSQPGRMRS